MQIGDKVKVKGYDVVFEIDIYIDGWALLKRERDNKYKMIDWYHKTDLIAL